MHAVHGMGTISTLNHSVTGWHIDKDGFRICGHLALVGVVAGAGFEPATFGL